MYTRHSRYVVFVLYIYRDGLRDVVIYPVLLSERVVRPKLQKQMQSDVSHEQRVWYQSEVQV